MAGQLRFEYPGAVYLGEKGFKGKLLAMVDKARAKIRKQGHHAGGAVAAHHQMEAERIIRVIPSSNVRRLKEGGASRPPAKDPRQNRAARPTSHQRQSPRVFGEGAKDDTRGRVCSPPLQIHRLQGARNSPLVSSVFCLAVFSLLIPRLDRDALVRQATAGRIWLQFAAEAEWPHPEPNTPPFATSSNSPPPDPSSADNHQGAAQARCRFHHRRTRNR